MVVVWQEKETQGMVLIEKVNSSESQMSPFLQMVLRWFMFIRDGITRISSASTAAPLVTRRECTVVWNNQESRRKYWATSLSVRSFAHTAHSFACSALLAPLRSFVCSLAHFTHSQVCRKVGILMSQNQAVLNHSAPMRGPREKIRR